MKSKKFGNKYIIRIDKGEEIIESLTKFSKENNIKLGTFTGLGATNKLKVGLFDAEKKEYQAKEFIGNFEINPLYGNISTMNGEVYIHAHINFADDKHHSFGGHLNYAWVSATFEGVITVIDGEINREFDEEIGLNLYKFE